MRSSDGGSSWSKIMEESRPFQQIIAAPTDFNTQYASLNGEGILKSTDGGVTWNDASTGLNVSGRLELAVSYSNPNIVWASTLGASKPSELYLTTNGGDEWKLVDVSLNGGAYIDFLGGQGWYDNTIEVNPFDHTEVYFGGVGLFHVDLNAALNTEDMLGSTTSVVADVYGQFGGPNSSVHPDQHFLKAVISDEANGEFQLILGNDGGMYLSDPDAQPGLTNRSWTSVGQRYNTTQFYGADKFPGVEEYGGGTQDNGTWFSKDDSLTNATSTTFSLLVVMVLKLRRIIQIQINLLVDLRIMDSAPQKTEVLRLSTMRQMVLRERLHSFLDYQPLFKILIDCIPSLIKGYLDLMTGVKSGIKVN